MLQMQTVSGKRRLTGGEKGNSEFIQPSARSPPNTCFCRTLTVPAPARVVPNPPLALPLMSHHPSLLPVLTLPESFGFPFP